MVKPFSPSRAAGAGRAPDAPPVTAVFRLLRPSSETRSSAVVNRWLLALVVLCAALGLAVLLLRARKQPGGPALVAIREELAAAGTSRRWRARRPPPCWQRSIRPGEAPWFAEYLSRFARRLRGVRAERLSELAAPVIPRCSPASARDPRRRAPVRGNARLAGSPRGARGAGGGARRSPRCWSRGQRDPALSRDPEPELARQVGARLHRFERWRPAFIASMVAAMGPAPRRSSAGSSPTRASGPRSASSWPKRWARLNDPEAADRRRPPSWPASRSRRWPRRALLVLATIGRPEHRAAVRKRLESPNDASADQRGARARRPGGRGGRATSWSWRSRPLTVVAEHAARGSGARVGARACSRRSRRQSRPRPGLPGGASRGARVSYPWLLSVLNAVNVVVVRTTSWCSPRRISGPPGTGSTHLHGYAETDQGARRVGPVQAWAARRTITRPQRTAYNEEATCVALGGLPPRAATTPNTTSW